MPERGNLYQMIMLESPPGFACGRVQYGADMWDYLPEKARGMGLQLHDIVYEIPAKPFADPVCLHDKHGRLLFHWPEGYIPTVLEVAEVCKRFTDEGG